MGLQREISARAFELQGDVSVTKGRCIPDWSLLAAGAALVSCPDCSCKRPSVCGDTLNTQRGSGVGGGSFPRESVGGPLYIPGEEEGGFGLFAQGSLGKSGFHKSVNRM